jgi:uncharacterized protein (TIGR02284 family)
MAVGTELRLAPDQVKKVQELIQINIDARDGFEYAAGKLENMSIAGLFEQMAAERRVQAEELSRLVEYNGEEPDRSGSFSAAVHRAWMGIRDSLSTAKSDDYAILAEAERGEDAILEAYEDALKCGCSGGLYDVLQRHYQGVKSAHDRVRDLRDAHSDTWTKATSR